MPDEKLVEPTNENTTSTTDETPEAPPQDLSADDVRALFKEPQEPTEDHGMSAVEPILSDDELDPLPPDADGGMQASGPILPEESMATDPPLPPSSSTQGAPLFTAAAYQAPGPEPNTPEVEAPPVVELPSNPELVDELITHQSLKSLWERADHLQQRVNLEINNVDKARELLNQIQAARNYMLAGRDHYEEAERALNEVEYCLEFSKRVRRWSYSVGWKLLAYEIFWAVLLGIAMFVVPMMLRRYAPLFGYSLQPTDDLNSVQWLIDGFKSMFWGGLGGITGALYALWRHIAQEQDFDKQYTMWYITNPIMGIALGAFIYIIMQAGLIAMTAGTQSSMNSAALVFVLAWLSGFQQNVAYDIIRRVLKVFRISENESKSNASANASS